MGYLLQLGLASDDSGCSFQAFICEGLRAAAQEKLCSLHFANGENDVMGLFSGDTFKQGKRGREHATAETDVILVLFQQWCPQVAMPNCN